MPWKRAEGLRSAALEERRAGKDPEQMERRLETDGHVETGTVHAPRLAFLPPIHQKFEKLCPFFFFTFFSLNVYPTDDMAQCKHFAQNTSKPRMYRMYTDAEEIKDIPGILTVRH